MKRIFDFCFALIGIILLSPLLFIIALAIKFNDRGPILFSQERIGYYGKPFILHKFRSMSTNQPSSKSLITIGDNDPRITKIGYFIRKYKLDELPQLLNVLRGEMSFVGPRPEVEKYVKLYTSCQREVLNLKPGVTDMASIKFRNESEILALQENPEEYYINILIPEKIRINLQYCKQTKSVIGSINIIIKTILSI